MTEPTDTRQVVYDKLQRAILLDQRLEKNGPNKEFITHQSKQHYDEVVAELKQIHIFLSGLNND